MQELQGIEVISLDIDILRMIPVHTALRHGAEGLVDRCGSLPAGGILAHPSEFIGFRLIFHGVVAEQLPQLLEVHHMAQRSRLFVARLGEARRRNLIERIEIQLCSILRG